MSSEDFANLPQQSTWLDEPGAKEILLQQESYKQFPEHTQQHLLQWLIIDTLF